MEREKVEIGAVIAATPEPSIANENNSIDKDFVALEKHIDAFNSLNTVYDQVSTEAFNFVDKGNYVLYNEYIKNISANLGMSHVPVISQEAIDTLPTVALNHHISLEGFIGDMWEKIKGLFNKITAAVKDFFTKYFTRLGRLKNKLQNLLEVLKETDKDISTMQLDKVPGSLAAKYPINGKINLGVVQETFANIAALGLILKNINDSATSLAKKDILDKDFVSKIKSLKDVAKASRDKIDANNANKGLNPLSQKNRELNKDNKSLAATAADATKEAKDEEGKVNAITNDGSNADIEFDDTEFVAAKKEFDTLIAAINLDLGKLKNKQLVGGITITSVSVSKEGGLELETDTNKETPDQIDLSSKSELIKLVSDTIKLVTEVEGLSKAYGQINDTITKSMDAVDKIIKDIDAIKAENLGKYKSVLTNKVKERLNLLKGFFTNYNKVCKSLFGMVLDASDGNVEYTVLCLKYFGTGK